jgi:hypothetical protein
MAMQLEPRPLMRMAMRVGAWGEADIGYKDKAKVKATALNAKDAKKAEMIYV